MILGWWSRMPQIRSPSDDFRHSSFSDGTRLLGPEFGGGFNLLDGHLDEWDWWLPGLLQRLKGDPFIVFLLKPWPQDTKKLGCSCWYRNVAVNVLFWFILYSKRWLTSHFSDFHWPKPSKTVQFSPWFIRIIRLVTPHFSNFAMVH